jgi:hypothetical protein
MMRYFLKATVLAVTLAAGTTSAAEAQIRRQESVTVFYDSEEHQNMVGQIIRFCDGGFFRSGTPTFYSEETYYGCD